MQQQQKQLLISPPAPLPPQHRYENATTTIPSRHLLPPPHTSPPMSPVYKNFRQHQMPVSSLPRSSDYYWPWNTAPENSENPQPPISWKNIVSDMILQTFTLVLWSYCISWVMILLWLYIINVYFVWKSHQFFTLKMWEDVYLVQIPSMHVKINAVAQLTLCDETMKYWRWIFFLFIL